MKAAELQKNEIVSFPDEKADLPRWLLPPLATVVVLHCFEAQGVKRPESCPTESALSYSCLLANREQVDNKVCSVPEVRGRMMNDE